MDDGAGAFRAHFGAAPDACIRVPGRVNLIGDHIDYCGLSVLPAAIQRRILLQFRRRADRTIRIVSESNGARTFDITGRPEPSPAGDWVNHVKAAVSDLMHDAPSSRGFDAFVRSDLPHSAGLSSSSALVVASALAFLRANDLPLDRLALASRLATAERYVGTEGGGMDQAIILLARKGHASRIDFDPLRATHVAVPDGWAFVIAHSLLDANKSSGAREAYNSRPREAEVAREKVAGRLGTPGASWRDLIASHSLPDLLQAAVTLHETEAGSAWQDTMARRFEHVVSESARVARAFDALHADDLGTFGDLMTRSHESLRTKCEVSAPRVDRLVGACLDAGAAGARLTGAGFGGCVIALTPADRVGGLLDGLVRSFYEPLGLDRARLADRLFVMTPSDGAAIED